MPGSTRPVSECLARWNRRAAGIVVAILCILGPASFDAAAQVGSARYSSIVVNAGTGEILSSVNLDSPRHPASLTKMMTIYMAFEALRDRRITLDQLVPVSHYAASMEPTKLGLLPGTRITVDQAILGLVTKSANDAAAALGELLGGTEERFAQMMTLRARGLGMTHTTFRNASGLPDPDQWTTARDLALLGRRLVADFPQQYRYFATPSFVWQRRVFFNHDALLRSYPGADGLKTGYTEASGYNLVSSAVRGGVRLVGVVMGASTSGERNQHMISLLNQAYDRLDIQPERKPPPAANTALMVASAKPPPTIATAKPQTPLATPKPPSLIASANAAEPPRASIVKTQVTPLSWAIQTGTFGAERAAKDAALAARRAAEAGEARIEQIVLQKKPAWRALVVGLKGADAQAACHTLARRKTPCIILRPEMRQLASR